MVYKSEIHSLLAKTADLSHPRFSLQFGGKKSNLSDLQRTRN